MLVPSKPLYLTSHPKVAGSNPTKVKVMIFRSPGVEKLGRTSSMNMNIYCSGFSNPILAVSNISGAMISMFFSF